MASLKDEYYLACQETFRRATNQTGLMLREVQEYSLTRKRMSILSVGAGTGLFEIPMLKALLEDGIEIPRFVGIDINRYACEVLDEKLQSEFGTRLTFEVINQPFQEFGFAERFDTILYNHVFEYLQGDRLKWIHKSLDLLSEQGNILIFSPNRGGINKIYAESMKEVNGFDPFFSEDIEKLLVEHSIEFSTKIILADCDISSLLKANDHQDKIKLLSFLTQMDCRKLSQEKLNEYTQYYKSLRRRGKNTIPHPATLFIL